MKDGYEEARQIDAIIMAKLSADPLSEGNAREYLKFLRTIKTTCEILENDAVSIVRRSLNRDIK